MGKCKYLKKEQMTASWGASGIYQYMKAKVEVNPLVDVQNVLASPKNVYCEEAIVETIGSVVKEAEKRENCPVISFGEYEDSQLSNGCKQQFYRGEPEEDLCRNQPI